MPDEVPATPAASPSSAAPAASPSAPAVAPAPAAAASPSSPATAGAPAASPARPDWAPEAVWDATTNTFNNDALKASFEETNALKAFKAADDSRKLALPQKSDDYKLALPKDWKAPEGIEFSFNEADPLYGQAREWAHKNGLTQDAFESGLAMLAASKVGDAQTLQAARTNEINTLGANATARVTAVTTWMDAKGYGELKPMLVTAGMVKTFEKMIADNTGGAPFGQAHREPPPEAGKINGIEKMDFRQARQAQDRLKKTA